MSVRTYGLLFVITLVMIPPVAAVRVLAGEPTSEGVADAEAGAEGAADNVPRKASPEAGPATHLDSNRLLWLSNYRQAWDRAAAGHKMLLIWFRAKQPRRIERDVERVFQKDASVRKKAAEFVLLELPVDATIQCGGKPVRLLEHPSFNEMHGHPGLAVVELIDKKRDTYAHMVSAFPFTPGKYYRFRGDYVSVILNLPLGTITERTMIWAVRTHPERPPSTEGKKDPTLIAEARSHSRYQARLGVQGHQRWGTRFQRLRRLFGWRYTPVEVVAESWPGQDLLDSCIDCVDSWHHSSGHWRQVRTRHARYAYDIQRGSNGIWYGTGLFAN